MWGLRAKTIQDFFAENQELGVRFLVNLLSVVADKVHRDQRRIADMRQNLIRTQKELKRLRELVLESDETPISAPVHDTLDKLITHNRRVNYRVEPPVVARRVTLRLEIGSVAGHRHLAHARLRDHARDAARRRHLADRRAPPRGHRDPDLGQASIASQGNKVTIELDLLIDEFAATLEGYLTRAQLLDVLV